MSTAAVTRPDVSAVLGKLKDFQRHSCEYVFRRLYRDQDRTRRFLLADEVGLGKTLVARGVIARVIDALWDLVPRIDIIYICSNADIARQNINKLNLTGRDDFALASRITLLPITLSNLKANKLNFVSLTPGTSFELKSSLGTSRERALLYWLLKEQWGLSGSGPLNVLQGSAGTTAFRDLVNDFPSKHAIDPSLREEFARALDHRITSERETGVQDVRTRFESLVSRFGYARKLIPPEEREQRKALVGDLRWLLAVTCLRALEPDLVILDEFQRFKHLLDGRDEASGLARGLFEYEEAKILLLSATPYKMYTLTDEGTDDNHYDDFIRTMRFLEGDETRTAQLEERLKSYRREVLHIAEGDLTRLRTIRGDIEVQLRRVMTRTERLAVTEDRDGMLRQVAAGTIGLEPSDLETYVALQAVARALDHGDTIEFWKSAPYLLNFMDDYELKRAFAGALESSERRRKLAQLIAARPPGLLPWSEIRQYGAVDPENGRLRALLADTVGIGAWRLLWIPPSLPYYRGTGPFADAAHGPFTKRLVFSSWRVVPRVITTLLSYEAERRMFRSSEEEPENTPEARARRPALLRFTRSDDRLTGMPVLSLLYPSTTLAREVDPLRLAAELGSELPEAEVLIERVRQRIDTLLGSLAMPTGASTRQPDETWYWLAPMLLDLQNEPDATRAWLEGPDLATRWTGGEAGAASEEGSLWSEHVAEARRNALAGAQDLGPPPHDLALVLSYVAVAGPGTAGLRALARVCGAETAALAALRDAAGQIAWAFRNLFNLPEATAMLRGLNPAEPYWRRVLEYCVAGNLQAVLDEYAHVLRDALGLVAQNADKTASSIAETMRAALSLRAVTLGADEVTLSDDRSDIRMEGRRLRARFALRLEGDQSEGSGEETRREHVREAFNSPFWPFVLATTSVGQEGLDFHPYSHAVVHWNLPSNPVDLEQREGRVHRYKGHAVRRNLARRYATERAKLTHGDPWTTLFEWGTRDRPPDASDLIPYWVYPIDGGATIERHVPCIPLSRDLVQLAALRRSLVAYRMIFGQPRQDDLVAYLLTHFTGDDLRRLSNELRIDLSPPQGT